MNLGDRLQMGLVSLTVFHTSVVPFDIRLH